MITARVKLQRAQASFDFAEGMKKIDDEEHRLLARLAALEGCGQASAGARG
jgi:hypothetical protein